MYGRISTKEGRERSRAIQFEALQNGGCKMEVYKDVTIFHHPDKLFFKSFHGTAANHTEYIQFRTIERLNEKIMTVKRSADSREKWKAEQKEKNKGKLSNQAAAAAAIRAELKTAFPGVKFSVTSEGFAGGDSVNVSWIDGPTSAKVEAITGKYQYGSFNGMADIYEYTNRREDIPQAKYVHERRDISDDLSNDVAAQIEALNCYEPSGHWQDKADNVAKQLLYFTDIPLQYDSVKVATGSTEGPNGWAAHFTVSFVTPQQQQAEPEKPAPVQVPAGKIQFIDYSANSFAVIGETKQPQQPESEPKQPEPSPEPEPQHPNFDNLEVLPTPENNALNLESFRIIWHEGRHIPGATFENATFKNWHEVQKAFTILWDVNEKGSGGGYTKVKCEIKIRGEAAQTFRIDITDKAFNGDFNPSLQHITDYLADDMEMSESDEAMRNALLY